MNAGAWALGALVVVFVIGLIGLVIFRMAWVTDVEPHEFAFAFDRVLGKTEVINKTGWVVKTPFRYTVHTIDTRPYQVTIAANNRILNVKLVKFNPTGLATFISWHGRDAGDLVNNMNEILKSYAFDADNGRDCPFLTVTGTVSPNQTPHEEAIVVYPSSSSSNKK